MQKRIYIETTIPSAYYTLRMDAGSLARQRLTRQWWEEYANQFILTSSIAVATELRRARSKVTQERLKLLEGVELFASTNEIQRIAQVYIDKLIMPQDPLGDALHLAIASFHKIDALLTWNLAHIANPNKFDFITQINRELGLPMPLLTTPLNYLEGTI
ncbi:MAG: type II toxin-antitoxin system VapC family toxin [Candidatus Poribacteria bacterium]|nr:type II toxin-antitoxin system VapC family toxin [Candidatus Poribacteria bacterium]MYK20269.1 type II toxin-antitoxin system VapC family toxin [Candidatus Poribacteria bacterium]